MATNGRGVKVGAPGVDEAGETALAAVEGTELGGVSLGDFAGAVDFVIGDDEHAAAAGGGRGGDGDRVEQIHRAIGAHGGGGAHGADEDDRFGGADDEV